MRLFVLAAAVATAMCEAPGCNVKSTSYYDEDLKFCDLVHQASPFGKPDGVWKGNAQIDPVTGWPVEDFSLILVGADVDGFNETVKISGFSQSAPTIAQVASNVVVLNNTYDASTKQFVAFVSVSGQSMDVGFTNTNGGVTNLTAVRTSCSAGQVYHPAFVAHLSRCSLLRMMDYLETNGNPIAHWSDRPVGSWPQWSYNGTGAPLEAVITLANEVGRDIWINIPLHGDDDLVTRTARLLHDTLDPALNIYTEWSNEVWNWGFQQSHDALTMANVSVTQQGDPFKLNYDGGNDQYDWQYRFTAYNAAVRLPTIFKSVFGQTAVGKDRRVRPVLASQIAYDEPLLQGIDYLLAVYGPLDAMIHSIAGAPYFSSDGPAVDVDSVLASVASQLAVHTVPGDGTDGLTGWNHSHAIAVYATLAAWHRVYLNGYEGGPDFSRQSLNYTITAEAQRDTRFSALMTNYYLNWSAHGSTERINQFTAGASNWAYQYGNWGLLESMLQPVTTKTIGFDAAAAAPRPPNGLGIKPGTKGFPAGYYLDCYSNFTAAGPLKPSPYGGAHGRYLYPINLAGASASGTLVINMAATNTGSTAGTVTVGFNNDPARAVNVTIPVGSSPVQATFALNDDDVTTFGGLSAIQLTAVPAQPSWTIATLDVLLR